jgi:hypothetical protein
MNAIRFQSTTIRPTQSPVNNPAPVPPANVDYNEPIANVDINEIDLTNKVLEDLGPQVRLHAAEDVSKLDGMVPTTSQLQAEFNKLAGDKEIPFEYIINGCFARAHLMCDTMHKDNINSAKIFAMIDHPETDALTAHNKYMDATWHHFHVAPLVFAQDEKSHEIKPFVMDPSMADHPLQPQEWVRKMWDGKAHIHLDFTRDDQYVPLEFQGANSNFAESLASSHQTAAEFSAKLAEIKQQYEHDHPSRIAA